MQAWLASSLVRHYPASRARGRTELLLHAARGERISFQCAFRTEYEPREVTLTAEADGLDVQVRRVGYVPVPHLNAETPQEEREGVGHLPGYVPDPLFPETTISAGPYETNAFWVTVRIPTEIKPGRYPIALRLTAKNDDPASLLATIRVHAAVIQPRRDFPATHWFYADALCDWYKLEPFEDAFWPLVEKYLSDLALHNLNVSHTPLFTPPTDGVKRMNQLLDVRRDGDRYRFDWSLVKKWVATARTCGLTHIEWPHLFTQWGAKYAIRIYEGHGGSEKLLWDPETPGVSPTYRDFLRQFLPEFRRFLEAEGLLEVSFFHLSPWMKVMDALSDITFAREGLTDIPIPLLTVAPEFVREGYPAWCYHWGGPKGRYAQRLLDTPLIKTRMFGWLFYRTRVRGFLQWGHNYWYKSQTRELIDPYVVTDALRWPDWSYGDPFVVYPGDGGPVDCLRWEVFGESLQDYALLQTAGLDPDNPMLSDIQDFAEFPRNESWIRQRRLALLRSISSESRKRGARNRQ
jgi:hypothetical protein